MKKIIKIFIYVFIFGVFDCSFHASAEINKSNVESKIHNLPIENSSNNSFNGKDILKPYPLSSLSVAAKSVNNKRNPFSEIAKNKSDIFINPNKYFKLNGIIKSGTITKVMLSNTKGVKLYKEGDYVNKDFKIKTISFEEETVLITNGEREFNLAFETK